MFSFLFWSSQTWRWRWQKILDSNTISRWSAPLGHHITIRRFRGIGIITWITCRFFSFSFIQFLQGFVMVIIFWLTPTLNFVLLPPSLFTRSTSLKNSKVKSTFKKYLKEETWSRECNLMVVEAYYISRCILMAPWD